jgi:cell shape-determining protein MreC
MLDRETYRKILQQVFRNRQDAFFGVTEIRTETVATKMDVYMFVEKAIIARKAVMENKMNGLKEENQRLREEIARLKGRE